jgi:hypothetical protein
VEGVATTGSEIEWLVAPLLADGLGAVEGGTELLIEALAARCQEAVAGRQ